MRPIAGSAAPPANHGHFMFNHLQQMLTPHAIHMQLTNTLFIGLALCALLFSSPAFADEAKTKELIAVLDSGENFATKADACRQLV